MNCPNCQRQIATESNFCYFCGARQVTPPGGTARATKRLMRSVVDCKIAGVCGGVAEYFEIDSTIVRLVWVLLALMPVPVVSAVLGYIVAWIVMPKAPRPAEKNLESAPSGAPQSAQPA